MILIVANKLVNSPQTTVYDLQELLCGQSARREQGKSGNSRAEGRGLSAPEGYIILPWPKLDTAFTFVNKRGPVNQE